MEESRAAGRPSLALSANLARSHSDQAMAFNGDVTVEGHRLVALAACQVGAQRQARPAGGAAFLHRGGGGFQPRLGGEQLRWAR